MEALKFKKYSNRKFYDVENSCYVNLTLFNELIAEGTPVVVLENATGKDITLEVILQAAVVHGRFTPQHVAAQDKAA